MKTRLLCLALVLLFIVGCSKEKEETTPEPEITSCKLMEAKDGDGGFTTTYQYNEQGIITNIVSVLPNTTHNAYYYDMVYDASGKLVKKTWSSPSINLYAHIIYDYNSTGQMIRQNFNIRNQEGNYEPVNYYISEYNSPDELKNRRLYQVESSGDVLLQTEEFFYENGLMVKVEVKGQNEQSNKTYYLEYDNKNNPFSEAQFGYFEKYGYPYKHNVTKTTALDYKGQVIADATHTISYTYNQQGYPLTLTGLSQSNRRWDVAYTYNCK